MRFDSGELGKTIFFNWKKKTEKFFEKNEKKQEKMKKKTGKMRKYINNQKKDCLTSIRNCGGYMVFEFEMKIL